MNIHQLARLTPFGREVLVQLGELVHLDIKKLGKIGRVGHRIHGDRRTRVTGIGIGWEYTHVATDDHSRLAHSRVLADETTATTAGLLRRAVAWYAALNDAAPASGLPIAE